MNVCFAFLSGAFLIMSIMEAGAYFEIVEMPKSSPKRVFMAAIGLALFIFCLIAAVLNN
jgi:hypothetical protein